ncbi:hypothetical protein HMPREF1531_01208 [Propionibacterium sp. oral taxon 192 str. F0372]|uniref:WXG100-like domain-containing protein n=1 Tax=Propionibacterium sp. oral taxon 192 TaxID=671222 RepID=UPI000353A362|nr:hypothetical protein [Propionibacterium sp. oral taxon 192]EPH03782.1 hypothetical protein HMPREF1531_01208 [Propionibacterium sp. oral taxon 192 str. F0372]
MLPSQAATALNYLGFNWPTTNEDVLKELGDAFRQLSATIDAQHDELESAVGHVRNNNQGEWVEVALNTLRNDGSELDVLSSMGAGAVAGAEVADVASTIVLAMKVAVAAQLVIAAASLAGGPLSIGVKFAIRFAINAAIDKVASTIMGEG